MLLQSLCHSAHHCAAGEVMISPKHSIVFKGCHLRQQMVDIKINPANPALQQAIARIDMDLGLQQFTEERAARLEGKWESTPSQEGYESRIWGPVSEADHQNGDVALLRRLISSCSIALVRNRVTSPFVFSGRAPKMELSYPEWGRRAVDSAGSLVHICEAWRGAFWDRASADCRGHAG